MSLQHTKNLLNKINALHKSIEIDGEISSIERDLMLSYTRQFYEAFLMMSDVPTPTPIAAAPVQPPVVVETPKPAPVYVAPVQVVPPTVVEAQKVVYVAPPVVVEAPKPAPVYIAPVQVAPPPPIVIEESKPIVVEYVVEKSVAVAPPPSVVEQVKVEIPAPRPIPPTVFPEPPRPKAAVKPLIKPANERVEQSELFEEKMGKELSDKLSESPLDDIKKGMNINDRIIFMRELFGGNQAEFDAAVNILNNSGSFEVARRELSELAAQFDWASKAAQAKPFIRLVRRRYN